MAITPGPKPPRPEHEGAIRITNIKPKPEKEAEAG